MAPKNDAIYVCKHCTEQKSWIVASRLEKNPKCKYCQKPWPKKPQQHPPRAAERDAATQQPPQKRSTRRLGKPPWKKEAAEEEQPSVPEAVRTLYNMFKEKGDTLAMDIIAKEHPALEEAMPSKATTKSLLGKLTTLDGQKQAVALKIYKLTEEIGKERDKLASCCSQIEEIRTHLTITLASEQGIVVASFEHSVQACTNASEEDMQAWPEGEKERMQDLHKEWEKAARESQQKHRLFLQHGMHLQAARPRATGGNRVAPYGSVAAGRGPFKAFGLPPVDEEEDPAAAEQEATQQYGPGGVPVAGQLSAPGSPGATSVLAISERAVIPGALDADGDVVVGAALDADDKAEQSKKQALEQIVADAERAAKAAKTAKQSS